MDEPKEPRHQQMIPSPYYLVSQDSKLPNGGFALQLPNGEVIFVDKTAVTPHQITTEQAAAFVEAQLRDALAQTQTALGNLLTLEQRPQPEPEQKQPEPQPTSAGANLAHDLLGFTPADLEQDPELVKEKVDALFNGIKSFLQNVTAKEETGLDAARAQMQSFRHTLDRHGIATHDNMEQLPDKINDLFRYEPQDRNAQFATELQKLADKIRETAVALSASSSHAPNPSTL